MIDNLNKAYKVLADDESKDIFLKLLNYYVSEEMEYVFDMVEKHFPGIGKYAGLTLRDFISTLPPDKDIILYPAGKEVSVYFDIWKKRLKDRLLGFCDKSKERQNEGYLGYPVFSLEELTEKKNVICVVSSFENRGLILRDLNEKGFPFENVFCMPWVGVIETPEQYFDPRIIRYEREECFVDAGCYDLNTSLELKKYANVKKVFAFEPDPVNYRKCLEKKEETGFKEAELFCCGLWSKDGSLMFDASGKSVSHISESGSSIEVRSLDSLLYDERVSFIKMDIEGAEIEALKGAEEIIKKQKPKLAISIYHKPDDLFEIPLLIKEYNRDYKLYIRHYGNRLAETVLYAV